MYNMPITIGFFSWEWVNHFPFISYGKNLFGVHPVWYKSKDLEQIKDVYRGTTVFNGRLYTERFIPLFAFLLPLVRVGCWLVDGFFLICLVTCYHMDIIRGTCLFSMNVFSKATLLTRYYSSCWASKCISHGCKKSAAHWRSPVISRVTFWNLGCSISSFTTDESPVYMTTMFCWLFFH
jgi:hypothetical protein